MTKLPATTYELQLRFAGAPAVAAATKRAVLAELARRGVTSLAEGVVDGVDVPVGGSAAAALVADDGTDSAPVAVFDYDEAALVALAGALCEAFGERLSTRLVALATQAWSQAWAADFETLSTRRFNVQPLHPARPCPAGLIPLVLGGGTAFGSGRHATTQAALEALESLPEAHPRDGFLDVGTGTGVLALAAARLGFRRLVGTDIDAEVLAEAAANAALNAVPLTLHLGAEPPPGERAYAVVAANILVPVLHHLMPQLARALAPDGSLLLAGFIDNEAALLVGAAQAHGLRLLERRACRGWAGLRLVHA